MSSTVATTILIARPIFIETTAWVDLALNTDNIREEILRLVTGRELWTSAYVKMEVRRTAGRDLRYVRDLVRHAPAEGSLFGGVLRALTTGRDETGAPLSQRRQRRCQQALAMVSEAFPDGLAPRRAVIALLDQAIDSVESCALLGSIRLIDQTDCDLVQPTRPQGISWPSRPLSCNAARAACRQCAFLERERTVLEAVQSDPDFVDLRARKALPIVLATTPLRASGERRCWPLGDIIIALEARQVGAILTSNAGDYGPICRAAGLALEAYRARL